MGSKTLPKIVDAIYPLYIIAFLMGHDDPETRHLGVSMLLEMASDCAEWVNYMNHIQTCQKCNERNRLIRVVYISLLEEEQ